MSEVVATVKGNQPTKETMLEQDSSPGPACVHVWVIDAPAGPVSKGACRTCGEKREFHNYVEGSYWGSDVSLEQLSGASRFGGAVSTRSAVTAASSPDDE